MANCTYCGWVFGNVRDHVIPSSYYEIKRSFNVGDQVMACNECNSFLGNKIIVTIQERARYLEKQYRRKYKKILALPPWSATDLEDVSTSMRQFIILGLDQKRVLHQRLDNLIKVSHCPY